MSSWNEEANPGCSRGVLCDRRRGESVAAAPIVKTKSRIPRESAECKAVRPARRTEKIETLGSSRMTKILEEIGAESDVGIKLWDKAC